MIGPRELLIDYLQGCRARGETHVFLDDEAKGMLRELYLRQKNLAKQGGRDAAVETAPDEAKSATLAEAPKEPVVPTSVEASGDTAEARIASLREQAGQWPTARALGTLRGTMVFSVGSATADLMLIGEAPGYHEERKQEPFVGPAGQKLDAILKAMGLTREEIYLSNIVKFRPAMPRQTNNNRKPTAEEMAACLPFIREEIRVVQPKCIVALGATAAEGLLGLSGAVGKIRGCWHEFDGIPARVTYHPAYLLHSGAGLKDKRMIWEDMLDVMEQLALPISEKQRGFFLSKD